jgi:predicted N-formylglutamate amidohydrolase
MIDDVATRRGLSNALIEVRQDLIATPEDALIWADRLARLVAPLIADREAREPRDFGSRAAGGSRTALGA